MVNCIVCKAGIDKYKCPNCLQPYCSVDCFKAHKLQLCEKVLGSNKKIIIEEDRKSSNSILFPTVDTVSPEKLEMLKSSEKLQNLLHNPHLRNFLVEIDSSQNAWQAIRIAMMEPLFLEFADDCLNIVGINDD